MASALARRDIERQREKWTVLRYFWVSAKQLLMGVDWEIRKNETEKQVKICRYYYRLKKQSRNINISIYQFL